MDDRFTRTASSSTRRRVLMAGPCDAAEANSTDAAPGGSLPDPLDRAVRALTASWRSAAETGDDEPATGLHLSVAPVPGSDGSRIAVFVRRSLTTYASRTGRGEPR